MKIGEKTLVAGWTTALGCALLISAGTLAWGQTANAPDSEQGSENGSNHHSNSTSDSGQRAAKSAAPTSDGLVIDTVELPTTYPKAAYEFHFAAHGGVPTLHWRVESGTLPAGLKLEDNGLLHGAVEKGGEYRFEVSVTDGNNPRQAVQREYVVKVIEAITMVWKVPAHVSVSRIEGSVAVTNTTADDMDFTFVAMAVAENGRATAIGYQRFPLKRGTVEMEIPFGETLPFGNYMVHIDANGEVAAKTAIYKEQLETKGLHVVVGP